MKIISVSEMRRLEQESSVPLETLMQTAGENACAEILRFAECTLSSRHRQRYIVVTGKGNNGGDALVVAKCLHKDGYPVEVFSTCPLGNYSGLFRLSLFLSAGCVGGCPACALGGKDPL